VHRAVLVCIALCLLAAPSSARLIAWEATSGLLPWDTLIPEVDRFTASGRLAFAVLTPTALHINDATVPERIVIERAEPMGTARALQIDARIIAVVRNPPAFALQSGVADGERYVPLGVTPTGVGFISEGGTGWIDGLYFELDTTDAIHRYDHQRVGAAAGDVGRGDRRVRDRTIPRGDRDLRDVGAEPVRDATTPRRTQSLRPLDLDPIRTGDRGLRETRGPRREWTCGTSAAPRSTGRW
jgi:hypothetical protein